MKPSQTERNALAAAATGSIAAVIPALAWAHHGNPGESLWHDIEYLVSAPGLVLLIAAALVGGWVVVRRVRHAVHKKSSASLASGSRSAVE